MKLKYWGYGRPCAPGGRWSSERHACTGAGGMPAIAWLKDRTALHAEEKKKGYGGRGEPALRVGWCGPAVWSGPAAKWPRPVAGTRPPAKRRFPAVGQGHLKI
jgi:hypothetical protein